MLLMKSYTLPRQLLAELLGTFFLVFCGTGAIVINDFSGGAITHSGIAITFGLTVTALIYTFGEISGAHFNPAVTIGFAAAKRFAWKEVPLFILAQLIGAVGASLVLNTLFAGHLTLGATLPKGSNLQSLIFEFLLTYLLMLVILRVSQGAREKGITAALAVGAVVALEAMFAGPVCGASMNPFRSFAPALVSGNMSTVWIYFAGPVAGVLAAVFTEKIFTSTSTKQ
jgi:aquaporin NIP